MGNSSNLWEAREQALAALRADLRPVAEVIEEGFTCLDECIDRTETLGNEYGRVCGLTLVKARNLILGMYSLALDGLAQEGGALLRPLIGTIEKLVYFRQDPSHVKQAINDILPKEGKISQKIGGELQELRNYLSKHAAHSGFSEESHKHLIDFRSFRLRKKQTFNEIVLRKNLEMVFSFLILAVFEGQKGLATAGFFDDEFAGYIEALRDKGLGIIVVD